MCKKYFPIFYVAVESNLIMEIWEDRNCTLEFQIYFKSFFSIKIHVDFSIYKKKMV
jgi:hypothetical protein